MLAYAVQQGEKNGKKPSELVESRLHGMTPLHYGSLFGHVPLIQELLRLGSDVHSTCSSAVDESQFTGNWPLSSGDPSGPVVDLNDTNITALHLACCSIPQPDVVHAQSVPPKAHGEVAKVLIDAGANIHARTGIGKMLPIHYAAIFGQDDCIMRLLEAGATVHERDEAENDTPLSFAVKHGRANVVKMLVKGGADSVAYHQWGGYNLLHLAVDRGHAAVVKTLLDVGVNVNAQTDHDEETALLLAARKGNLELVRLLLEFNADPDHRNVNGLTALNLAYSLGFFDVAALLMQSTSAQQASPVIAV